MSQIIAFVVPEYDDTEEGMLEEIGNTPESILSLLSSRESDRLNDCLTGASFTPDPVLKMAYLRSARLFCREARRRAEEIGEGEAARLRADRFYRGLIPLVAFLFVAACLYLLVRNL